MNALDGVILGLAGWTAWAGFRLGFAHRVLSWIGFLVGLWFGSMAVAQWLGGGDDASAVTFLQALGVLLAAGTVGQVLGGLAGRQLRRAVTAGGLGPLDAAGGVAVGLIGLVVTMWFVVPAMADVAGWPANQARNSAIATRIVDTLGTPPRLLDGLSEALDLPGAPNVFDSLRSTPPVPTPPLSPVEPPIVETAADSVLRITGPACGRVVAGSGWVAAPDLIVTNAHVVAGIESVTVEARAGARWTGRVVAFDPRRDLAVIRVRGLDRAPLVIDPAEEGDIGVVLGFPGGGELAVAPYMVGESLDARGEDIYGNGGVLRKILVIGSTVKPGDSGGPLIDPAGQVAGVVFAVSPDREGAAYAIRTSELDDLLAAGLNDSVRVGACL